MALSTEVDAGKELHPSVPGMSGRAAEVGRSCDPEWKAMQWSGAGHDNYACMRAHSDETEALATAIDYALRDRSIVRSSALTAVDCGGGSSLLNDHLGGLVGTYVPVPIDGREADRLQWKGASVLPSLDVCVFTRVVPAERFAAFLTASGVRFTTVRATSESAVAIRDAALELLTFFAATDNGRLLSRLAIHLQPDTDRPCGPTSAHRGLASSMHAFALREPQALTFASAIRA